MLPAYIAKAADLNGSESETIDTLAWWKSIKLNFQNGSNQSVKPFLYIQLSSSAAERVFFHNQPQHFEATFLQAHPYL